jgi:phage terminase large subunit
MNINIDKRIYNEIYLPLFDKPQPLMIVFGGGSSGKSRAMATNVLLWCLRGEAVLIARQTLVSIGKSTWLELNKLIREYDLTKYFTISKSDKVISCVSGGSIQCVGAEDVERIKSITPIHRDSFSRLWIEEATELSSDSITQLRIRMRGVSKYRKQTILTFNPIYKGHHLFKSYFEAIGWDDNSTTYEDDNLFILKTTYLDNRFLDQSEVEFLEGLKTTTPYFYNVYTLGNFGTLGARVFENWKSEWFDVDSPELKRLPVHAGVDFGFSVDPATLSLSRYDEKNKIIYIFDEIYEKGLTNDVFAQRISDKLDKYELYRQPVYCDSAEPKSIQELRNHGIQAHSTTKGKDSILKGIDWLLQHRIIVHPNCKYTQEEFMLYCRKEKNGEVLMEPEDKNNHIIDSVRYAYAFKSASYTKPMTLKSNIYG